MEKTTQEVVIDTDFFSKVSKVGFQEEKLKRIVEELGYALVVHTYIDTRELDMNPHYIKMKAEGSIKVISYADFLSDGDKKLYEYYFHILYQELTGEELRLPQGRTIFDYYRAGSSFGEIHSVLMAVFMKIPIFLSDDSDAEYVGIRAKILFNSSRYSLQVYNIVKVLTMVAEKEDSSFEKTELVELAKKTGHPKAKSEIGQAWNRKHE